ncbi:MAG: chemotaxis protein CheW [Anaerolineae bacterium]|nr:chemotaxis protein CheW [Anaerolineae bacterium]
MERQLVIFELGEENFGVDISAVESIIKLQELTKVPHAPGFVEGITNLRGTVLPVIDLRKRFGMEKAEATKETRIVVINMDKIKVGMVVDSVSEVLTVPDTAIESTPAMVSTVDTAFIVGIAKVDDRLIILLDLEKVLSTGEQASLQALPEMSSR